MEIKIIGLIPDKSVLDRRMAERVRSDDYYIEPSFSFSGLSASKATGSSGVDLFNYHCDDFYRAILNEYENSLFTNSNLETGLISNGSFV